MVVVHCQAKLLEIVAATHSAGRFTCGLDGGQQQPDEHANDGDHNEQLDEREPACPVW